MESTAGIKAVRNVGRRQFIENLNVVLTLAVDYSIEDGNKFSSFQDCCGLSDYRQCLQSKAYTKVFSETKQRIILVTDYRSMTTVKLFFEINLLVKCSMSYQYY